MAVYPKHFDIFLLQIISGPARNLVKSVGILSPFSRFLHLYSDSLVMCYFTSCLLVLFCPVFLAWGFENRAI